MTVVEVAVQVPSNGGQVPAVGSLRWQPSGRRVAGGVLVLPQSFGVDLAAGVLQVDVEPTDGSWAWMVTEQFVGFPPRRRYFAVPEAGPVLYTDLIEVSPSDFETPMSVSPDPENPGFYLIGV